MKIISSISLSCHFSDEVLNNSSEERVILRNEVTKNLETQSDCTQILRFAQDDKKNGSPYDKTDAGYFSCVIKKLID